MTDKHNYIASIKAVMGLSKVKICETSTELNPVDNGVNINETKMKHCVICETKKDMDESDRVGYFTDTPEKEPYYVMHVGGHSKIRVEFCQEHVNDDNDAEIFSTLTKALVEIDENLKKNDD